MDEHDNYDYKKCDNVDNCLVATMFSCFFGCIFCLDLCNKEKVISCCKPLNQINPAIESFECCPCLQLLVSYLYCCVASCYICGMCCKWKESCGFILATRGSFVPSIPAIYYCGCSNKYWCYYGKQLR